MALVKTSATTFNGREQVSISDNRGVEFDLYPSEIMAEVNVYKTPNATLEAEGIAGVIDMRTIKPLDTESRIQVRAEYEYNNLGKLNPDSDDTGINTTFSYIDQFADDKIGFAFAHARLDSPNQENRWNSWGYLVVSSVVLSRSFALQHLSVLQQWLYCRWSQAIA